MVVRLKDYGKQKQEAEPKKKGPVRLSDISSQYNDAHKTDAAPKTKPFVLEKKKTAVDSSNRSDRMMSAADSSKLRTALQLQTNADRSDMNLSAAASAKTRSETQQQTANYASEPPIIRDIHRGMYNIGETKPAKLISKIGEVVYTPGGSANVVMAAERGAANLIGKFAPGLGKSLGGKIAKTIATQTIVGAPLGVGNELTHNPEATPKELLTAGAYGGGGGAVVGTVGRLGKAGIQMGVKSLTSTLANAKSNQLQSIVRAMNAENPTLALPEFATPTTQKLRGNLNHAGTTGVIHQAEVSPRGLPAPSDELAQQYRMHDDASQGIGEINNELFSLSQQRQRAINDHYKYLKESRDARQGITQGNLQLDQHGDVIGRTGRQSNNPQWYRDFYAEHGRTPSNKDIYNLAKKYVDEGTSENGNAIPSWKAENRYDETVSALNQVREELKKSLISNQVTTVEPLKATKMKYVGPRTPLTPTSKQAIPQSIEQTPNVSSGPVRAADLNQTAAEATAETPRGVGPVRLSHYTQQAEATADSSGRVVRDGGEAAAARETTVSNGSSSRGQRANFANQLNNGNFSPELTQGIKNTDKSYDVAHNVDTVAAANANVKNITGAEATFLGNREYSPEHIATGYRLLQELDRAGQLETNPALRKEFTERALNVSEKLAADLTLGGQTVQAASLLKRLSPEGQLMHLQRQAKKAGKEVTVADADMYRTLAKDVQQSSASGSHTAEFLDILDRLKAGKPVSADEMKRASLMLEDANSLVNPSKLVKRTKLPDEFKDPRKRDKIISFLDEAEQAALARIRNRKGDLNSLPLGEWADHAVVVASQIAKGTIKAATYTEDMVKLFGESIRPHANNIYDHAHKMITGTAKHISEGKLDEAKDAFRRLSGQAAAEKEVVKQMAEHVKKVITDAKTGNITPADIQKIREFSDEIANFPVSSKMTSDEQRFLQNVKSLAKKIADVEQGKTPPSEATREVSTLLRQVTKLTSEEGGMVAAQPMDSVALRNLAHDLLEKTRPVPKPQTISEKVAEKFIKEGNISPDDVTVLRELAKQVNELKGAKGMQADMKMQQILNNYQKSSFGGKVSTVRYMSMLLNTSTQAVNAVSGPVMMAYNQMLDIIITPFDLVYSKAFNAPRSTTWKQGPGAFDNLFTPIVDWFKGLKVGGEAGWQGVDPEGIVSQHDIRGLSFKSKLNPLGIGERTLGAVAKGPDYATYSAAKNMELRKLAYLDAVNKGVKGKENIREHMDKYLANPDGKGLEQASRLGKKITFQNTDGLAGKTANVARSVNAITGSKDLGVANAIVPFIRTPLNIAITGVENTPAGVLKGLFEINRLRNGADDISKREILKTFASATAGGTAILGGLGYILSNLGIVTGDYSSTDKEVQGLQDAIGKGKFRFNTNAFARMFEALLSGNVDKIKEVSRYREGDKQFDYNKLQPLAFPFAAGASLADQRKVAGLAKARGEIYPLSKQLGAAASSAGSSLYGMSSLQGLSNTFRTNYNSHTPQYAQIIQNIGESFIKGFSPSTLAQEARRQDPVQREITFNKSIREDVGTYFRSRLPGQSQSLAPKITRLGDTKENAPGIRGQYLNPLRSEKVKYNEAADIIMGLIERTGNEKLAPTAMDKDVQGKTRQGVKTKIKLTAERYAKLQEDVGKQIAAKVITLPTHISDEKMAEKIEEIYKTVREAEREKLKKELDIHW